MIAHIYTSMTFVSVQQLGPPSHAEAIRRNKIDIPSLILVCHISAWVVL